MHDTAAKLRQASEHLSAGRLEAARSLLQRVLAKVPSDRGANLLMRHTLTRLGEQQQALYYAERALSAAPSDPEAVNVYANSLLEVGRVDDAVAALEPVVVANPRFALGRAALANLYGLQNRYYDCVAVCAPGIESGPADPRLSGIYAAALVQVGRADEAVEHLRVAVRRWPTDPALASLLCGAHNYAAGSTPEAALEAQRGFGRCLGALMPGAGEPYEQTLDPGRRLRVGLVSSDFRAHASAFFTEPLLEKHDRERMEIVVFSTTAREDAVSARLRGHPVAWRHVPGLSAVELAQRVRAERIDVLIDLAGHTYGHSLLAFHLRPAPLQCSFLGYPAAVGVPAVTHRLADSLSDPPGAEAWTGARITRIDPCGFVYRPPPERRAEPVVAAPSARGAPPTFGSFSSAQKMTSTTLRLWARTLEATPGSRLLLKHVGFAQARVRDEIRARLAALGLAPERVIIEGPAPTAAELMREYARVDVGLDTFPYAGQTTVCEAAFMGVPVVCLMGRTAASRFGGAIMTHCGLAELATETEGAFVAAAAGLARDAARVSEIRRTLRDRLLASPVCDEDGFCARFEAALRALWRERCAAG